MDSHRKSEDELVDIKVVGVGGGGSNAVNRMIETGLNGVEFIAINTDAQALALSNAPTRVRIGRDGLGAGGDPERGQEAAEQSRDELGTVLEGAQMVFIAAGYGGGTGTGASPIVAEIARDLGALTVAVVTKPFAFEGARRRQIAEDWLAKLDGAVDTLIAIENQRLLDLVDDLPLGQAFLVADELLRQGIQGISELITEEGDVNTDFNDVKAIMKDGGTALMTIGRASGEERALAAAEQAITSPLLDITLSGAKGVLFNIKGGPDMALSEVSQAAELIQHTAEPDANIIWGAIVDDDLQDQIQITLVATGFELGPKAKVREAKDTTTTTKREQSEEVFFDLPDDSDFDIPPFLRHQS